MIVAYERRSGRSARKREAILQAATELFWIHEYAGTSMVDIAVAAGIEADRVQALQRQANLFREVALGSVEHVSRDFQAQVAAVADATDVQTALWDLARSYVKAVMNPVLLRRRQLVLREAGRFPDLARRYHDSGPRRTIGALTTAFAQLAERGELQMHDPRLAATQFAFLVIGEPLDTVMFRGVGRRSRRELNAIADAGVEVFLAAYEGAKQSTRLRGSVNSNS